MWPWVDLGCLEPLGFLSQLGVLMSLTYLRGRRQRCSLPHPFSHWASYWHLLQRQALARMGRSCILAL